MNKCVAIFIVGMSIATVTYAFFDMMMNMPRQMMMMPQQMMQPNNCDCTCKD